ncbi:unnamed protein product [Calypogeia fissa]
MKELGTLKGPGIRIELASDTPIFRQPYRYSDMERDLIRSRTLDLLEAGLVEILHGEYASPTVMPVKKDIHGNYTDRRMCGDYRPINRITKSDKYARPTPEEVFDVVGHARVFRIQSDCEAIDFVVEVGSGVALGRGAGASFSGAQGSVDVGSYSEEAG